MATYHTPAIIIRRHNLGEADRILSLVTPERGVVRAVAKGVRRIKSRLAGHLELFGEADLMLAEGRSLDIITSARLRHDAGPISADLDRLRHGYLLAEMIDRLSGEEEPHPGLFELASTSFRLLSTEAGRPGALLELWYKLRLLAVLGYRPELHADDAKLQYRFVPEAGRLMPASQAAAGAYPLSIEQIKLWRLALANDYDVVARIGHAEAAAASSMNVVDAMYDHIFGRRFKSSEVLQ